ncbi:hypothetical protein [Parabacteroides sp.]|jgi:hypothetical protein|uniref:hypothetical protein n=1 Tax=Parabacteroides sp. TaxID=1869337 RepID=UPI003081072B
MALTQDELDQVYNYVMGKGQSLAGLPDGGGDLTNMYLAPLLKYSPDGKASLVRLAVAVLKGDSAYQVWVKEPGNEGKSLSDFFAFIKGAQGDPFTFADFTPEQLADLALTYEKLTPEQKEEMKLHFGDLTEADILVLQKPATDAAEKVLKDAQEVNDNLTADVVRLEERAETVIRETGESKELADRATKAATDAAGLANDKADLADKAAQNADKKADKADKAADETLLVKQDTEKVKQDAEKAIELTVEAAALAKKNAGIANDAAQAAKEQAGVANKAAQGADKATQAATDASDRATTLSNNRDKIVAGYWWKYDETLKDYVNTTIRATGETGQGLNIVGRYQTSDLLFAAYPDGVVGCFEVGTESPYEIWYYDSPAAKWRNSGRLQGPAGMTAFQVWKLQPGNENKTELDFFKSLSPYIGGNKNWWLNGVDLGIKAPGTDAYSPRINKDSHKWEVYDDEQQKYVETNCLAEGVSVKVEIVKNTPTEYKLKFTSADGEFITPNLIVRPVSNNGVLDIDHEPTAEDTHYTLEGVNYPYLPGQEVRFKDGSDITFFKCYDNSEVGAVWEEAGAGSAPVSNIYLQGANYFNRTVQVIKNGYIENKEVRK